MIENLDILYYAVASVLIPEFHREFPTEAEAEAFAEGLRVASGDPDAAFVAPVVNVVRV